MRLRQRDPFFGSGIIFSERSHFQFILRVSQHQEVLDKWDRSYKNSNLKDEIWQSVANQWCSDFSEEALVSVKEPQTVPPTS